MTRTTMLIFAMALHGCVWISKDDMFKQLASIDMDEDGVGAVDDCNDNDPNIHPGAEEICDGKDNNCDGTIDDHVLIEFYADADEDGYGDAAAILQACDTPSGYVENADDCDDSRSSVNPNAEEVCDELDNDCDEDVDEGVTVTVYTDGDGDTWGLDGTAQEVCDPTGYALRDGDCQDDDPDIYPGAEETCEATQDMNCDGFYGSSDNDEDGYAACDECDDGDFTINPDADEVCDDVDNNCDDVIDTDAIDQSTWYEDSDEDNYGNVASTTLACEMPEGYVGNADDCDDTDNAVYPDATESVADGVDQDCDGVDDCYEDSDEDGYGSTVVVDGDDLDCADGSSLVSATSDDCDDTSSDIHPEADELCNEIDDDCDGTADNDLTFEDYYVDSDSDGYGDEDDTLPTNSCVPVSGAVTDHSDCDDTSSDIHPGADEIVDDGVDQNCDGGDMCYEDADGDGYGSTELTADDDLDCTNASAGESDNADDCDDGDDTVWEGQTWYLDNDEDGYGDADSSTVACNEPSGYVDDNTDCDDDLAFVNPAASPDIYTVWDVDCSGADDKANEAFSTELGTFTFSAAATNLFTDEDGDSTFFGGSTNWTWYENTEDSSLIGLAGDYTTATYSDYLVGTYDATELPNPTTGQGVDDMCLISTPVSLTVGDEYALCVNVEPSAGDNQGLRLYTKTDYDTGPGYPYYMANPTIIGGEEAHVCGAFTASGSTEQFLVCTGNWTTAAGAFTQAYVGKGSY